MLNCELPACPITEEAMMSDELRVAVLNADPNQLASLREQLSGPECAGASFDTNAGTVECTLSGQPDVLLVYGTDDPEKAVELCRQVREAEGAEGGAIVAGRYGLSDVCRTRPETNPE